MRRQILNLIISLHFFIDAIEVFESYRNVLRHARQQSDDLLVGCPRLGHEKQDHTYASAEFSERHGTARNDAGLKAGFPPRLALFRVEDVLVGACLLGPERVAANSLAVRILWID